MTISEEFTRCALAASQFRDSHNTGPRSIPPIADAKAAAERILRYESGEDSHSVWPDYATTGGMVTRDAPSLARFTLAVLDAPGMSAEQLAKLQQHRAEGCLLLIEQDELFAEILRLRAELKITKDLRQHLYGVQIEETANG